MSIARLLAPLALLLTTVSVTACRSTEPAVDLDALLADATPDSAVDTALGDAAGSPDAAVSGDAAADAVGPPVDTVTADVGADAASEDAASEDAADASAPITDTPWGPIEGAACGTLSAALASPDPSFYTTTWTFTADTFDASILDTGPARRYREPNAGGSSKCSEVMSMQWLIECEGGVLYKTETEIVYDTAGHITDYAMTLGDDIIGVSVTRAYLGPHQTNYDLDAATVLLTKKLDGINDSTANVSAADAWPKQILHIWTLQPSWVPILEQAWQSLTPALRSDTVVLVTVEAGSDYIVTDTCDD